MTLEQLINAEVAAALDSDRVKQVVEKRAKETVDRAIEEVFSCYGPIGKQIKEGITSALKIDFRQIDLPEYNQILSNHIQRTVISELNRVGLSRAEEQVKNLLSGSIPSDITLEKIVEELISEAKSDSTDEASGEVELIIKPDGDWIWIYLNPTKLEDRGLFGDVKYKCAFRIMLYKGEVSTVMSGGFDFAKKNFLGDIHGFEAFLFKLYSCRAKVTGTEPDVVAGINLEWSNEEDED